MLSASAERTQEVGKEKERRETARHAEDEGTFFLEPASIQIKSYYFPLALRHCGFEWSMEEASLQQRTHCRMIRALWAGRPPLPVPREAPQISTLQGEQQPRRTDAANVLNALGRSFLHGG